MITLKKVLLMPALLVAMALLAGCKKEGPAERTGERIDETTKKAGEKAKEGAEKTGEAVKDAGEKIREETK